MSFLEKLQQYSENKQSKINLTDLNAMVAQVNNQITCGPNCKKDRKSNRLKSRYEHEKVRYQCDQCEYSSEYSANIDCHKRENMKILSMLVINVIK